MAALHITARAKTIASHYLLKMNFNILQSLLVRERSYLIEKIRTQKALRQNLNYSAQTFDVSP
jgi:hypothetical protein